jgi:hypothetical protein
MQIRVIKAAGAALLFAQQKNKHERSGRLTTRKAV